MGVPDEAQISMCQGKQRFGSFDEAGHALSRRGFGRTRSHQIERYRCHFCRFWHVGGAAKALRQKPCGTPSTFRQHC